VVWEGGGGRFVGGSSCGEPGIGLTSAAPSGEAGVWGGEILQKFPCRMRLRVFRGWGSSGMDMTSRRGGI
jgi:hypothetical protein